MAWRLGVRRLLDVLILALVVWLLGAAAYVSLGRLLVPAIADYREELVARAEVLFERRISVRTLAGEMQGAQPVLLLRGLRVQASLDPDSAVLLELDNVTARLDLFASLWRRQPVLDAVQVEGLALEVHEEEDGRWILQGLGATGALEPDIEAVLDGLANLRRVTLLDSQIRIRPQDLPDWVFTDGDLTLLNHPRRHRLDARVSLPDGQELALSARAQRGTTWQASTVDFYADLPTLQWSQWLPSEWLEQLSVNYLIAGGRYWGRVEAGRLSRLRGEMRAPQLALQTQHEPQLIEDLQAQFLIEWGEARQSLHIDDLQWQSGDLHWQPSRLMAELNADDSWRIAADRADLQWIGALLPDHLADPRPADILRQLDLRGTLRDLQLAGGSRQSAWSDWLIEARLESVSLEAWQAVPGFENISGSVKGTPAGGSLRVDSRDWSMRLPRLFEHAWRHDRLRGEMTWEWAPGSGLQLLADGMRIEGEQGLGAVRLALHLPRPEDTASMDLQVSLRDSAAIHHGLYLPTRAPAFSEALADWLAGAELEGRVPLAIFSYSGSIESEVVPGDRALALYARLEAGRVRFQPDWPALEAVEGTLRLQNQDLLIEHAQARLWNTQLENVRLTIDRQAANEPLRLNLTGAHSGPLSDALRVGQETPVAGMTDQLFADWRGSGEMVGELDMQLPLQAGANPALRLAWEIAAGELWIPQLQAPLDQISGRLAYQHGEGLSADELSLSFLGQPVNLAIVGQSGRQRFTASASHGVEALRTWSLLGGMPLDLATGTLDWQATLLLDAGQRELSISSDLRRLGLDLPAELGKSVGQTMPSRLTVDFRDAQQRWSLEMGEDLYGVAQVRGDSLRAELRYRDGQPRRLPVSGLALGARFIEFDLALWQAWIAQRLSPAEDSLSEGGPSPSLDLLHSLEFHAARFVGMGRDLSDLSLSGERRAAGLHLRVEQSDIAGTLLLPEDQSAPLVVDLQRLRFERPPPAERGDALVEPVVPQDPLAAVQPSRLPAMDVQLAQIIWGEDRVADARFSLRPYDGGAMINGLSANVLGGLRLEGQIDWRETAVRSQFNGQLSASNIGEVLRAWQYAPTLTSSEFSAGVDLTWPGSPAFFALKRGTGELQLKARDGVVQSGEGSAEALRIFGLLNFNALTRRLRLDFSDIFGKGTAYDSLDTQLAVSDGVLHTRRPLVLDGPSARIELDGIIDLPQDSIDMGMLVTLPITNNLPMAAILVGAPYLGGVLFLADRILGDRISRIASVKYRISGDWLQPTVDFDRAFDNKAALEE
jgi:uncharacterized protein (TIGR02099 family)